MCTCILYSWHHSVRKTDIRLTTLSLTMCGVPQGSLVGHLLFNLYMPPLGETETNTKHTQNL